MRFGLFPRFLLLMVGLAVLPVGLAGTHLLRLARTGIQASVLELQTKLAARLAAEVAGEVRATGELVRFTEAALTQDLDWAAKQELLRAFIRARPGASEVAVLDASGRERLKVFDPSRGADRPLRSHASEPAYARLGGASAGAVFLEPGQPAPRLRSYHALPGGAVLHVAVEMKPLWERLRAERVGGTGFAVLVDREGRPLIEPEGLLSKAFLEAFPTLPFVRQALAARGVGAGDFRDHSGEAHVAAYAPVPELGGAVLILQPKADAYAAFFQMRRQGLAALLLLVALAALVSYLMARWLTRPILELTEGASSIARGDFSVSVRSRSDTELKDLAEAFNYMARELARYAELQVEKLVAEQKKTEAILFSIEDGILMTDFEGRILLANRKARSMLGLPSGAALEGRSIRELLPDEAVARVLASVLARPEEHRYEELDLSEEDRRRVLRVSAQPVVPPGSGPRLGTVAALHDITLEKELEAMKELLFASMTHDLRSPMSSIRGFIDLLSKEATGPLSAGQRRMLESMDKASFRLLNMINNMLDMAKLKAGRLTPTLSSASMKDLAARTAAMIEPLARLKEVRIVVAGDDGGPLQMDPDLMERVLTNLLSNAVKYAPAGTEVLVETAREGGELRLSVADRGPGVPAEERDRLFRAYEQGRSAKPGGTGLGLAVCRSILEAHLGRIVLDPSWSPGARLSAVLPVDLETGPDEQPRRSGTVRAA